MQLSTRLQFIYERCLPREPLWDLCCDHGLLGLWALEQGTHPEVIFNDCVPHVLESLPSRIGARSGRILCANAEVIAEPLTGTIAIAGVGGEKITLILQQHANRGTLRATRVVVCPEKDAEWMMAQPIPGYTITERVNIPHGAGARWIAVYEPQTTTTVNSPKS